MKLTVNKEEVFASTGGRPFDKNKPLLIFLHGSGLITQCGCFKLATSLFMAIVS